MCLVEFVAPLPVELPVVPVEFEAPVELLEDPDVVLEVSVELTPVVEFEASVPLTVELEPVELPAPKSRRKIARLTY